MKTSPRGIALVKEFESCRLAAYLCDAKVPTIGYGHTAGVELGDTCTEAQAEKWLAEDLGRFEAAVNDLVTIPITQGQFDALVVFSFNIGEGAFSESFLLQLLNQGKHESAGDRLLLWNKVNAVPSAGLTRRRVAERHLFYSQPFLRG